MIGIDYAAVDGDAAPDLAAAIAAGVRFAIIRGSYERWPDPTCARDRDAIRTAGLTYGAYMFALPGPAHPTPEEQVATFEAGAHLNPGQDLPAVIDIEFPGKGIAATGLSRVELAAWIGRAVAELERRFGCKPMVYTSARVLDDVDADCLAGAADAALAECPLWLARYALATRQPGRLDADGIPLPPLPRIAGAMLWAHQYQGDAVRVPGFNATVDLSRWFPLGIGEAGARVQWVHSRLGAAALTPGANEAGVGAAVRAYQAAHGLTADGVIGPATFARLAWEQPAE